jgi:hypothetical protein
MTTLEALKRFQKTVDNPLDKSFEWIHRWEDGCQKETKENESFQKASLEALDMAVNQTWMQWCEKAKPDLCYLRDQAFPMFQQQLKAHWDASEASQDVWWAHEQDQLGIMTTSLSLLFNDLDTHRHSMLQSCKLDVSIRKCLLMT